jgi:hypothetical protein
MLAESEQLYRMFYLHFADHRDPSWTLHGRKREQHRRWGRRAIAQGGVYFTVGNLLVPELGDCRVFCVDGLFVRDGERVTELSRSGRRGRCEDGVVSPRNQLEIRGSARSRSSVRRSSCPRAAHTAPAPDPLDRQVIVVEP